MIALVTGASSGIGAATARRLAREPGALLVLVARREERLRALADELGGATVLAHDLTAEDAPETIARAVEREHGRLDLLVNNAGAAWPGTFEQGGTANLRQTFELNLFAQTRLTEALLPLLTASAPSAIVNVVSTSGRIARRASGAYSASKFAMIGWSDALHLELRPHGIHVGIVNPGFVVTEGFPQRDVLASRALRWTISSPEKVAEAVVDTWRHERAERYAPRPYVLAAAARLLLPGLTRRVLAAGGAALSTRGEEG